MLGHVSCSGKSITSGPLALPWSVLIEGSECLERTLIQIAHVLDTFKHLAYHQAGEGRDFHCFVEEEPSKAASLFDGGGQLWIVVSGHVCVRYQLEPDCLVLCYFLMCLARRAEAQVLR